MQIERFSITFGQIEQRSICIDGDSAEVIGQLLQENHE